jgi:hypothetical protein
MRGWIKAGSGVFYALITAGLEAGDEASAA